MTLAAIVAHRAAAAPADNRLRELQDGRAYLFLGCYYMVNFSNH